MKVTIIITVYNEEKYIEKCLNSLKKQTFNNWEIIIVDDGSKDNTKNLIKKLKFKNLKYLYQKHLGLATARNLGAKKAKGEILVFLDGDMFFSKNFLKILIEPILKHKTKGTYSTQEYVANWEDNIWARCWNYNWRLPGKKRVDPGRKDQAKEFRAILRKEFYKVKGLDSVGYTDAWTLPAKLGYNPTATKALYYHYNPATLKDVFLQAKWAAVRKYKLGFFGKLFALFRANPIFATFKGIILAISKKEPGFLVFKLVFDFGTTLGILKGKKSA